jgi:CheY-like chemotaxis protein
MKGRSARQLRQRRFALSGDEHKAKDAGATAYLAKPYSPFYLLTLIRKLLPEG